ncbi:MAG: hypothetical protein KY464_12750 [Gemmatimonadetes bacterium]|nr:hypothetical protein [Gemmatimonadota bacterium]
MTPSETTALRAELRLALHDLSDLLLEGGNHRHVILDGIRHAWILADLADVGDGVLRALMSDLQRKLADRPADVDRAHFARHMTGAADQL